MPQFLHWQVEKGSDNLLNWGWGNRALSGEQERDPRGSPTSERPFQFPQHPGTKEKETKSNSFLSPTRVRDEDTSSVASSLLFFVSFSSHPNSYSFLGPTLFPGQTPHTSSEGSGASSGDFVSEVGLPCVQGRWWLLQVSAMSLCKCSEDLLSIRDPAAL